MSEKIEVILQKGDSVIDATLNVSSSEDSTQRFCAYAQKMQTMRKEGEN
mgnify:FL=1|jgi:hypothetical protein